MKNRNIENNECTNKKKRSTKMKTKNKINHLTIPPLS